MPLSSLTSTASSTISLPSLRQVDGLACWLEDVPAPAAGGGDSPLSAPSAEAGDKGGAAQGAGAGQADVGGSATVGSVIGVTTGRALGEEVDQLGSDGSGGAGVAVGLGGAGGAVGRGGKPKPVRACGPCKVSCTPE